MRKWIAGLTVVGSLMVTLLVAPVAVWAQGVVNYFRPVAQSFRATAPSGQNGFYCVTDGCRVDLGTGANDYFVSDGSGISTPGTFVASGFYMTGGGAFASTYWRVAVGTSLPTCAAGYEGTVYRLTGTGGTNSGSATRFCACISDGAASPTYSYRNMLTGTAGNATTCNP